MIRSFLCCLLLAANCFFVSANEGQQVKVDVSAVSSRHPRLLMNGEDFALLKSKVASGTEAVISRLHGDIMQMAEKYVQETDPLEYKKDASGKRILHVSFNALRRISFASYAYRMTGDGRYLEFAESNINAVCDFPDWNESHFLDVAEMALAVAVGYDWLYDDLSSKTKVKVEKALHSHAFRCALNEDVPPKFYDRANNWNQVCNSGLVAAAITVCDKFPQESSAIIEKAVASNRYPMEVMYSPDGNYPEGYNYWKYGTQFEIYMLKMLDKAFGTDFGLSATPGFLNTGDFMLFMEGICGGFNHSDCGRISTPSLGMWYFAEKLGRPDLLVNELKFLEDGVYMTNYEGSRSLPLIMSFAMNIEMTDVSKPQKNVYYGRGQNPVLIVRKDWTSTDTDAYLGIKAGKASNNHGHMDAGSFVYDAYGVRWSLDLGSQKYAPVEKALAEYKASFWDMKQNSMRWSLLRYHNLYHSTVSVNEAAHVVDGEAVVKEVIDDSRGKGMVMDMTPVLGEDVKGAERTVMMLPDNGLKVIDRIAAPDGKKVRYTWRMVTPARPTVLADCILLEAEGHTMKLEAKSDVSLDYMTWDTEPKVNYDDPNPGMTVVGVEAVVPAGKYADFTVTLSCVDIDVSPLATQSHPRLLMDEEDFKSLKKKMALPENKMLSRLNDTILLLADRSMKENKLEYKLDVSGKRLLHVSRSALKRITSCSYAYRMTGDRRYLDFAETDLKTVCAFPDWNQSHFLDVAEMAMAVAVGYDWLYDDISSQTRLDIERALNDHAFRYALDSLSLKAYHSRMNNWNQVCNSGMIAAAIAVGDKYPEIAEEIITESVESNRRPMELMYSPDGNYVEGYGYWKYGTLFEVYMLKMLEKSFGTDFGLSQIPGFLNTGDFMLFMQGPCGAFNHSDSPATITPAVAMWYFADKLGRPDLLYHEVDAFGKGMYLKYDENRMLALLMCFAMNVDTKHIRKPETNMWYGMGDNPLALVRADWSSAESDAYLAVKAGKAFNNHGHMDAGSFVYDAYGVRWSMDLGSQAYAPLEKTFKEIGGSLWNKGQKSRRWTILRYNNQHHSTVTVNDAPHKVKGEAVVEGFFDDERGRGMTMDMKNVLGSHVKSAERTVMMRKDKSLEVCDKIVSPDDKPVLYSWRMVTSAEPKIRKNGIVLKSGGKKMKLRAQSGLAFEYKTWSAQQKESYDEPNPGVIIVGIEAEIPAGGSSDFVVTLSK